MVQYFLRFVINYLFYDILMLEMKMKIRMTLDLFLLVIFCAQCAILVADNASMVVKSSTTKPTMVHEIASNASKINVPFAEPQNETSSDGVNQNHTLKTSYSPTSSIFSIDNGAVKRTFYVVASLTGLVLVYIAVKAIRTSRKRKPRRYGLLVDQEMDPLDDDDEDTTLFEAKHKKKIKK